MENKYYVVFNARPNECYSIYEVSDWNADLERGWCNWSTVVFEGNHEQCEKVWKEKRDALIDAQERDRDAFYRF